MSSQNYILHVTAGPHRDRATQETVHVNTEEPVLVETESMEAKIWVRIRGYRGLPRGSPETAPYFTHPKHRNDRYSIQFNFRLKEGIGRKKSEIKAEAREQGKALANDSTGAAIKDHEDDSKDKDGDGGFVGIDNGNDNGSDIETTITGDDIVLGNDFDRPIRDKLPPGFSTAFRIVKWFIDPGIDGDVDADEPYLYGPLLSSINTLEFGGLSENSIGNEGVKEGKDDKGRENKGDTGDGVNTSGNDSKRKEVRILEEGGLKDDAGMREKLHIPSDSKARMKYFLNVGRRKQFIFEKGREYRCDFYNPYLDFNEFALRLPGFTLNIMSYWDGQPLRYVLKNRSSDEVYFVVCFDLLPVNEHRELLSPAGGEKSLIGTPKDGPKVELSEQVEASGTVASTTVSSSRFSIDDQSVD